MINLGAILPYSPLLLYLNENESSHLNQSIQQLANDIVEKKIETIITIAPQPITYRDGYSIFVHPNYSIRLNEFGDLKIKNTLNFDWDTYYSLLDESKNIKQLEPIDDQELPYTHAIPLHLLDEHLEDSVLNKIKFICLNNYPTASDQQKSDFAKIIKSVAEKSQKSIALIAIGNLYETSLKNLSPIIGAYSQLYRNNIVNNVYTIEGFQEENILPPSLHPTLSIVKDCIPENLSINEYSYIQKEQTGFIIASYK